MCAGVRPVADGGPCGLKRPGLARVGWRRVAEHGLDGHRAPGRLHGRGLQARHGRGGYFHDQERPVGRQARLPELREPHGLRRADLRRHEQRLPARPALQGGPLDGLLSRREDGRLHLAAQRAEARHRQGVGLGVPGHLLLADGGRGRGLHRHQPLRGHVPRRARHGQREPGLPGRGQVHGLAVHGAHGGDRHGRGHPVGVQHDRRVRRVPAQHHHQRGAGGGGAPVGHLVQRGRLRPRGDAGAQRAEPRVSSTRTGPRRRTCARTRRSSASSAGRTAGSTPSSPSPSRVPTVGRSWTRPGASTPTSRSTGRRTASPSSTRTGTGPARSSPRPSSTTARSTRPSVRTPSTAPAWGTSCASTTRASSCGTTPRSTARSRPSRSTRGWSSPRTSRATSTASTR